MRRIDELFMSWSFLGSRRIDRAAAGRTGTRSPQAGARGYCEGWRSRRSVPKPTSPAPRHEVFLYPLRKVVMERPNPVWAADVTYVP
jgi:putative transposase